MCSSSESGRPLLPILRELTLYVSGVSLHSEHAVLLAVLLCRWFWFYIEFYVQRWYQFEAVLWLNIINRIRQSFNTSSLAFIVFCRCSLGSLWQVAVWKMSTLSTTDITDVGHGKTLDFLVLECEIFTCWIKIRSCQNRFDHFSHT